MYPQPIISRKNAIWIFYRFVEAENDTCFWPFVSSLYIFSVRALASVASTYFGIQNRGNICAYGK